MHPVQRQWDVPAPRLLQLLRSQAGAQDLACRALACPCSSTPYLAPPRCSLPGLRLCQADPSGVPGMGQKSCPPWHRRRLLEPFPGAAWRESSWTLTHTRGVSCTSSLGSREGSLTSSWGRGGWGFLLAGLWFSPQPGTRPSSATSSTTVQIYIHRGCLSLCLSCSEEKPRSFLRSPTRSSPLRPCSRTESYTSTGRSSPGSSRSSRSLSSHHKTSPRYSRSRSCSSGKR